MNVVLKLTTAAFEEVKTKLEAANDNRGFRLHHDVGENRLARVIDMNGIEIEEEPE